MSFEYYSCCEYFQSLGFNPQTHHLPIVFLIKLYSGGLWAGDHRHRIMYSGLDLSVLDTMKTKEGDDSQTANNEVGDILIKVRIDYVVLLT